MKIDGHCHCGRITFEAEVDPTAGYARTDADDPDLAAAVTSRMKGGDTCSPVQRVCS